MKSPQDNKEQKNFLGYEWSNSKGNEGIRYNGGNTVYDIITPMFNPQDRQDNTKISYLIQQNFSIEVGKTYKVPENLIGLVSYTNLADMLDFTRTDFNKAISLNMKKKIAVESKWDLVKLGDVCEVLIGGTPSRDVQRYFQGENLWVSIAEMNGQVITNTKEKITDEGVQKSNVKLIKKGTTLLSFKLSIGKTAIVGADLYTNEAIAGLIPKDKKIISDAYLFHLFTAKLIDLSTSNNVIGQSLNSKYLRNELKIPLPPLDVQEKIILEIEELEKNKSQLMTEGISMKDFEKVLKEKKQDVMKKYL